jgi:hypothetical protein
LKKVVVLFLLTAALSFAADPATALAIQARDIVIGTEVVFAEMLLGFGLLKAGFTPIRGIVFVVQALVVVIGLTHIRGIVDWAGRLSIS